MICQLCLKDKGKLCKAHIIPKSFIKFMYPNGKIEGDALILIVEGENFTKKRRVGMYDESILCSECDGLLGRNFDEYGTQFFLKSKPKLIHDLSDVAAELLELADYTKIKLFLLSVFWRFAIAKIDDTVGVKLPKNFLSRMREMIYLMDVGSIHEFSIIITKFKYIDKNKGLHKYFGVPARTRFGNGCNGWILYLPNGYKIYIKVDQRPFDNSLFPVMLANNKPIYVISHEVFETSNELKKLLQSLPKNLKK